MISPGNARAHFTDDTKIRDIVLTGDTGQQIAYVRMPLALVFADVAPPGVAPDIETIGPFLYAGNLADGTRALWVSLAAVNANRQAFATRLSKALLWDRGAGFVPGRVLSYRIVGRLPAQDFNTPARVRTALEQPGAQLDPVFGEGWVEMAIAPGQDHGAPMRVRAGYPPFPTAVEIDNHVADHRGDTVRRFTMPGQLQSPLGLDRTAAMVFALYHEQGVRHIVEGIDHLALVVALTLGTWSLSGMAWGRLALLVTAFTLGHSITLGTTVFGLQPNWPPFIPVVETAIAASMLYTAIAAMRGASGLAAVYFGIGMVHGLGFSLMLSRILGPESPQLVWSLLSFNIGIEVGQLVIVALTWTLFSALALVGTARIVDGIRLTVLIGISGLAIFYIVDRTGLIA